MQRGRRGRISPPSTTDGESRRRRSSAPAVRNAPAFAAAPASAYASVATPPSSGGGVISTSAASTTVVAATSLVATSAVVVESPTPVVQPPAFARHSMSRASSVAEEGSPRISNGTTAYIQGTAPGSGGNGGSSGGLFSSLRSRVGKLNSSLSSSQRKESRDNVPVRGCRSLRYSYAVDEGRLCACMVATCLVVLASDKSLMQQHLEFTALTAMSEY
jgi:hypothetical protein